MPKEHGITPVTSDRAFYPLPHDIKNHVGNAKSVLELSKLDQENLRLKVEEWHKTFPQSNRHMLNSKKKTMPVLMKICHQMYLVHM